MTQPAPEQNAAWYDASWTRRVAIWQNHKMVSGSNDLVDFPAYFELTSLGFNVAQESGDDFLFTAADGVTKLSHEIREWDFQLKRLRGYVRIPCLSPHHDTLVFLYYGNPGATNQEDRAGVWKDYSFVGRPERPAEHALRVLEALFVDPALQGLRQNNPRHPAVQSYDALLALVQGKKFDRVKWKSQAADVGSALLDALDIRDVEPAATWQLIAEPEALRQIRSRLAAPDKFVDQYAVIRCWSLLDAVGTKARLIERPGFPDLQVEVLPEVWIEVKRLRLATRLARVRKVIGDANRKLKKASPQAGGIVYVEVSRTIAAAPLTDEVPPEILDCVGEVRRELGSGHSKTVGRVVVSWDEMATLGEPPHLTKIVLRRRTVALDHPGALSLPPVQVALSAGRTVDFNIRWS